VAQADGTLFDDQILRTTAVDIVEPVWIIMNRFALEDVALRVGCRSDLGEAARNRTSL
jgi:hypothetical protein